MAKPASAGRGACVDHHDHEALGALDPQGRVVGIARYIRDRDDDCCAEVAVTIVDEWQGRGLGGRLLELVSDRARAAGIVRLIATVALGNPASDRMIRNAGGVLVAQPPDCREYEISPGALAGAVPAGVAARAGHGPGGRPAGPLSRTVETDHGLLIGRCAGPG